MHGNRSSFDQLRFCTGSQCGFAMCISHQKNHKPNIWVHKNFYIISISISKRAKNIWRETQKGFYTYIDNCVISDQFVAIIENQSPSVPNFCLSFFRRRSNQSEKLANPPKRRCPTIEFSTPPSLNKDKDKDNDKDKWISVF